MPEPDDAGTPAQLAAFVAARPRLLRLAYRFMGSVAEAEDIVQEAWLRHAGIAMHGPVERPLARIVTNLALDRLKSAQHRHENYVGAGLPEPMAGAAAPDDHGLDLSFAIMRALERLSPAERAALFLHDLFDFTFEEIAETLERTPQACRQLASRARKALREGERRFNPTTAQVEALRTAFDTTRQSGDVAPLMQLLAEDAVMISDGGGKVPAVRDPLVGGRRIAEVLGGMLRKFPAHHALTARVAPINDVPGRMVFVDGTLEQTMSVDLNAAGAITGLYIVRNPDKLAALQDAAEKA